MDFTEARDSEWQWHQPDHMQISAVEAVGWLGFNNAFNTI